MVGRSVRTMKVLSTMLSELEGLHDAKNSNRRTCRTVNRLKIVTEGHVVQ